MQSAGVGLGMGSRDGFRPPLLLGNCVAWTVEGRSVFWCCQLGAGSLSSGPCSMGLASLVLGSRVVWGYGFSARRVFYLCVFSCWPDGLFPFVKLGGYDHGARSTCVVLPFSIVLTYNSERMK
ncbi:unnamed protein product [Amoebophrya sp. A120]|nr:unnamed protein product [Amoebophrya sp. A120]|eukprot:GSA120T00015489001.1